MASQRELDQVYDRLDAMLRVGQFEDFDRLLYHTDPWAEDVDVVLTHLTVSLPARTKLPSRPSFCHRVRTMLEAKGEPADAILMGLE